jgi:hypothetical protein
MPRATDCKEPDMDGFYNQLINGVLHLKREVNSQWKDLERYISRQASLLPTLRYFQCAQGYLCLPQGH